MNSVYGVQLFLLFNGNFIGHRLINGDELVCILSEFCSQLCGVQIEHGGNFGSSGIEFRREACIQILRIGIKPVRFFFRILLAHARIFLHYFIRKHIFRRNFA